MSDAKKKAAAIVGAVIGLALGAAMISRVESGLDDLDRCAARGVSYFKEIGSYPRLTTPPDAGRTAEEVARERCSRSLQAFP